jgi:hypothetical protein
MILGCNPLQPKRSGEVVLRHDKPVKGGFSCSLKPFKETQ